MLAILVIVPLLVGAFAALLLGDRPSAVKYTALAASMVSLILVVITSTNTVTVQSFNWFNLAGYSFPITTYTLPLNILLLFIVGVMTPLIFLYSMGFMSVPSEQNRFYFEMCLFAAAMMLFAMSGSFITLLIGWGLLGITSYLLIGFWYRRDRAPTAARKAITIVLFGDILMLIAALLIWNSYNTFDLMTIAQSPVNPALGFAMMLVLIAAFTKSAQFPFHEWLPDAMEGPTPVSAFLHSSTMVKAGVFLVAVLLPVFVAYHLLGMMLVIGMASAVLGATNALAETHIKRILAYSTIEDLGLMFVALGLNALLAAMLLFVVQTFYKALLFMGAGAIMKANRNEEQLSRLRSSQAGRPLLIATLIGVLSIAGIFPLSGFFGKVAVESAATNALVYALLAVVSFASSLYIFRWLFIPLRGGVGPTSAETKLNFKLTSKSMLLPMYILAGLAVGGALAYVYLPGLLGAVAPNLTLQGMIVETIVVLLGLAVSYVFFLKRSGAALSKAHRVVYTMLYNSMSINAIYMVVTRLFGMLAITMDTLNGALYGFLKALGRMLVGFAGALRRIETGQPNTYIIAFVLGLIAIMIILML